MLVCYESRKAGTGYPACCEGKNCDEERKKNPIWKCEMVRLNGNTWVDNFEQASDGGCFLPPLVITPENRDTVEKLKIA